jgi:hypothetical protein
VRDILGRLVLERKLFAEAGKQSWQMNFAELSSGMYELTLQGINGVSSGRMTVIH